MLCFFGHQFVWAGTRSASGTATRDVWRCERCGETKEVARL